MSSAAFNHIHPCIRAYEVVRGNLAKPLDLSAACTLARLVTCAVNMQGNVVEYGPVADLRGGGGSQPHPRWNLIFFLFSYSTST